MDAEIFVPFIFFGFIAAIVLVPVWLREKTKQSAHALIAQALEKGQPLDPALLDQIGGPQKQQQDRPRRTLGSGVILLALAGGFAGASLVMEGFDPSGAAQSGMMIPATILGCLGVAFIVLALVDYSAKKKG